MEEKTKNNGQKFVYEAPVVFCYHFDVETLTCSGGPTYKDGGDLDDDWGD